MIFIWGKRSYGAVNKVGNIAVKTVFGHLWYLPLFPMTSYYIDTTNDAAFELHSINWRSVLCGYVRVWAPLVLVISAFMLQKSSEGNESVLLSGLLIAGSLAAIIASYVLDKKFVDAQAVEVRYLMERHFGVALDPYLCANSMQSHIDAKMRSASTTHLEESWYKRTLNDLLSPAENVELAVLRARCDQHDKALQQTVLQKLPGAPARK